MLNYALREAVGQCEKTQHHQRDLRPQNTYIVRVMYLGISDSDVLSFSFFAAKRLNSIAPTT